MRFTLVNTILLATIFFGCLVYFFDFKEMRKSYHRRKLKKIVNKYLDHNTNNETLDQDIKKVFKSFSIYIENKKNNQEKYLQSLNLGFNESRIRHAYSITSLSVVIDKEKIEKSAKICGIELCF